MIHSALVRVNWQQLSDVLSESEKVVCLYSLLSFCFVWPISCAHLQVVCTASIDHLEPYFYENLSAFWGQYGIMCLSGPFWSGHWRVRGERVPVSERSSGQTERTTVGQTAQNATHVGSNFPLVINHFWRSAASGHCRAGLVASQPCPPSTSSSAPSQSGSISVWITSILTLSLTGLLNLPGSKVVFLQRKRNEASCRCLFACRHHWMSLFLSVINCFFWCNIDCSARVGQLTGQIGRQAICLHHISHMITVAG